jgi:hypothetical protein
VRETATGAAFRARAVASQLALSTENAGYPLRAGLAFVVQHRVVGGRVAWRRVFARSLTIEIVEEGFVEVGSGGGGSGSHGGEEIQAWATMTRNYQ